MYHMIHNSYRILPGAGGDTGACQGAGSGTVSDAASQGSLFSSMRIIIMIIIITITITIIIVIIIIIIIIIICAEAAQSLSRSYARRQHPPSVERMHTDSKMGMSQEENQCRTCYYTMTRIVTSLDSPGLQINTQV